MHFSYPAIHVSYIRYSLCTLAFASMLSQSYLGFSLSF